MIIVCLRQKGYVINSWVMLLEVKFAKKDLNTHRMLFNLTLSTSVNAINLTTRPITTLFCTYIEVKYYRPQQYIPRLSGSEKAAAEPRKDQKTDTKMVASFIPGAAAALKQTAASRCTYVRTAGQAA